MKTTWSSSLKTICPKCKREWSADQLYSMISYNMTLASDGTYVEANATCYHPGCDQRVEFYFPLTEINAESQGE